MSKLSRPLSQVRLSTAALFIAAIAGGPSGCSSGGGAPDGSGGSIGSSGSGGATTGGASGGASGTGGGTAAGSGGHASASGGTTGGGSGGQPAATGGAPVVTGSGGTSAGSGGTGGAAAGSGGASGNGGTASGGGGHPSASGGAAGAGAPGNGGEAGSGNGTGSGGADGPLSTSYPTEDTGADCTPAPAPPAFSALPAIPNLPDPFLMANGNRIMKVSDWRCRRAEISSQVQHWGSGPKGAPPATETATFSGGKLTVVVTQGSTSITLSSTVTTPSGAGPFPIVISMDGSGVPTSIFTSSGVATMDFTSSQLVPSSFSVTRGAGDYFKMYPDTNTGAMIEWAWGVSRLIDGLQKTASQNKIDTTRIAVKGCSYAGKMALYAGAFDERVTLTIPEESGGGGEASWRFMATQTGTEDLEAAQGTAWYAANLKQFKNADAPKLPYDQHELVAMVAPRAILAIENTGIDRLGSQAGSVSMRAAKEVYKALGVPDRIGYSQAQASAHCSFPSSQTADVQAFVDKFLLNKTTANTSIAKDSYNTDLGKWVTWTTPTLQ